jgi:recombinational DNA repair protein RecT
MMNMTEISGTVEVCCHRVVYTYDIGRLKFTDELKESLENAAEERAQEMIIDGCGSGELNTVWNGEREIRGWWNIDRE